MDEPRNENMWFICVGVRAEPSLLAGVRRRPFAYNTTTSILLGEEYHNILDIGYFPKWVTLVQKRDKQFYHEIRSESRPVIKSLKA